MAPSMLMGGMSMSMGGMSMSMGDMQDHAPLGAAANAGAVAPPNGGHDHSDPSGTSAAAMSGPARGCPPARCPSPRAAPITATPPSASASRGRWGSAERCPRTTSA